MQFRATGFATVLRSKALHADEQSAGVEFFLHRDLTERLGGFVSYTFSRSVTTMDGQTARSPGDRTHLLSLVLGYDLGRSWRVGTRFLYESGAPYEQTCQTPDCTPGQSPKVYEVSGTLPPFYRLDFRVEKRWHFAGGRWLAGTVECFNALGNAQPSGTSYSPAGGLAVRYASAIVLPSVGVEGGF
jgi:hypothetical protein